MKPKRKFVEGHSYLEIHKFTRALSFWELEESYQVIKDYVGEPYDIQMPVCIRLKTGDIRVKKYDEQIGLDPRDYYSNANDLWLVVWNAYHSRLEMNQRFLEGEITKHPQSKADICTPSELLNLKRVLIDLDEGDWVYFDIIEKEGKKLYIFEVVDSEIVRTIAKSDLENVRERNVFLFKYGNKNTQALDRERIENLLNHFRPAENLLEEVYERLWEL